MRRLESAKLVVPERVNGILLSHKKECNLAICNSMDGAREDNAKWNKSVRERPIPYDFICMWNLRNKTKEQREKKRDQLKNRLSWGTWGLSWLNLRLLVSAQVMISGLWDPAPCWPRHWAWSLHPFSLFLSPFLSAPPPSLKTGTKQKNQKQTLLTIENNGWLAEGGGGMGELGEGN